MAQVTSKKRKIWTTIGTVILVIILLWLGDSLITTMISSNDQSETYTLALSQLDSCQKSNEMYADLKECQEEKADLEDYVNRLNQTISELSDSITDLNKDQKKKDALIRKLKRRPKTVKKVAKKKTTTPEKTVKKAASTPQLSANINDNKLSIVKYEGVVNGDYGVTINGNGFLMYYLAADIFSQVNPTLDSPEIPWNKNIVIIKQNVNGRDYFMASDTVHVVTITELMEKRTYRWSWYIGTNNDWGYKMYIPHELVKPQLKNEAEGIFKNGEQGSEFRNTLQYQPKK